MENKNKALCEIYVQRNNEVIELAKQGMSWEEIQEIVAHYQDKIEGVRKKKFTSTRA